MCYVDYVLCTNLNKVLFCSVLCWGHIFIDLTVQIKFYIAAECTIKRPHFHFFSEVPTSKTSFQIAAECNI